MPKTASKPAATPNEGLPLFYQSPHAIDKERHAKAGIRMGANFGFSRPCNSIPLNTIEFIDASRCMPIVFTMGDAPMPAALVGLEQENYFVTKEGNWRDGAYIPAYVRQYPFIFFDAREEQKLILCVDEAAEYYTDHAGDDDMVFFENGEPSALSKNALEFCKSVHTHFAITRNFCDDLAKHGLLEPNGSDVTINSTGRKIKLGGFQTINEEKFNALPDEVFLEFRKKGWLAFIYLALASSSNWRVLVDYAAEREMAPKGNA